MTIGAGGSAPENKMNAILTGLFTGFSLIVAIGAQNAYLLRMGLTRQHVGLVVSICTLSDFLLINAGVGGVDGLALTEAWVLTALRWTGVLYLVWFAVRSFRAALQPHALGASSDEAPTKRRVLLTTLAITFLNPHVYIDAVLLLGSIGNQFGSQRWLFSGGACVASATWFCLLGFGASRAAGIMAKPITWRILDTTIGVVMTAVALTLAFAHITA